MNQIIYTKIKECLEECGIIVMDDEFDEPLDMDSMQYVSLIVQIEEIFNIMIDDEKLILDSVSLHQLYDMVESMVEISNNQVQ